MSDAYDMIARFLRNNLGDDDYADFSAALDSLCVAAPQQAETVPLTHVLVPMEPTDEMIDAACKAVDDLYRVDFVRAYSAAIAHLKAGYRDESYWRGWNAAIKFQQAEATPQYDLAHRLRVHLANRHTLTGPEFKDGVDTILAEYYAAPQQAETVPSDVVRDAERYRWLRNESWAGYNTGKGTPSVYTVDGAGNRRMMLAEEAMDAAIDAAIAAQGEKP